ncbi:MAG: hypothetical protein EOM20_12725 [Spartobacteria bacterium]|nr:hypothetical protein [Spartobacteria bacterium]
MSHFEQNAVSRAIWPWTAGAVLAADQKKMPRPMRALIQCVVMVVIALLLYFWIKHELFATIILVLAGVVLISGVAVPPVFDAIERFGHFLGKIVSHALTWILLVPFYYLCFAVGHFFMTLRGKDPMCREFPTSQASYWVDRPAIKNLDYYRKQH